MDNLTHSLVGLVVAKAGAERLSPLATTVCIIAANAPDVDVLSALGGHWSSLHYHRGITHSIIGTLALALLIPSVFKAIEWLVARWRRRPPRLSYRGLLLASLIASATHPLMDWTNNYGVRPLLPWSGQWYYGDLVFIADPWLWLMLGGAAFLLTATTRWRVTGWAMLALILTSAIFFVTRPGGSITLPLFARLLWLAGLIGLLIFHSLKISSRWSNGVAVAALALVVAYWGGLALAHRIALSKAEVAANEYAIQNGETLKRVAAMPMLANPWRWRCVAESNRASYLFETALNENAESNVARHVARYAKPEGEAAGEVDAAAQDWRGRIFLEFARFPVARVEGDCLSQALVQFVDLRYTEPVGNTRGGFTAEIPVDCASHTSRAEAR